MTYRRHRQYDDLTHAGVVFVHHPNFPYPAPAGETGLVELTADQLTRIDSYDTTVPTSPSPGRVYKKRAWDRIDCRVHWHDVWTVMVCELDPDDPRGVYHHPHEAIVKES